MQTLQNGWSAQSFSSLVQLLNYKCAVD